MYYACVALEASWPYQYFPKIPQHLFCLKAVNLRESSLIPGITKSTRSGRNVKATLQRSTVKQSLRRQVRRKGSPALRKGYESHVTMALMADDSLLLVMTCAGSGPSTLTFSGLNKARRFLVSQSSPRRGVTCVPGINPRSRQGSTNSYVYIL